MADAEVVAQRARLLAARRREEWPDDDVVAALVALSGHDPTVLEQAWRRCAHRDGDPLTRAAGALLHRAWARANGLRETVLSPGRPGAPARVAATQGSAPTAVAPVTVPPPPVLAPAGFWRRWWRRLRGGSNGRAPRQLL